MVSEPDCAVVYELSRNVSTPEPFLLLRSLESFAGKARCDLDKAHMFNDISSHIHSIGIACLYLHAIYADPTVHIRYVKVSLAALKELHPISNSRRHANKTDP